MSDYRPCRNELCDYLVAGSAAYCCAGCARADEGGYEVHESGMLGHSPACARRTVFTRLEAEHAALVDELAATLDLDAGVQDALRRVGYADERGDTR